MKDSLEEILSDESWTFIREHRSDDVRQLALQANRYSGVDMAQALQQIAGWQAARTKLPEWAAVEDICYPPHISLEQCSSELTAKYKASLLQHETAKNDVFIDLTGGFGVDFSYMSRGFQRAVYVEQQPYLCVTAKHNFQRLGLDNSEVVCGDGTAYLQQLPSAPKERTCIFLDPARRDLHGRKTYAIGDCTPDVAALKDVLREKADTVVIKLSPMLDWHKAMEELAPVSEVHIVSVNNECKEMVIVIGNSDRTTPRVVCVNISPDGTTDRQEFSVTTSAAAPIASPPRPEQYLYEPNASIMKAGCFAEIAKQFEVQAVGQDSHLFVSDRLVADFPGRKFQISAVSTMNKKQLKTALQGLTKANITVRNFPLSVAELRKRLKLADGGETYLFATTSGDKEHLLLFTRKA